MNLHRLRPACFAVAVVLLAAPAAFAQPGRPNPFDDTGAGAAGLGVGAYACGCLCWLVLLVGFAVIPMVSMWMIFTKAGKPGWAAIVPFYNIFVLTEIVEKPILWFILFIIPCIYPVMWVLYNIELAKKFGKDTMYGIGLAFLAPIFYPMLAFSDAQYLGTGVMPQS